MDSIVDIAFNTKFKSWKWTNLTHKRSVMGWLYNYQSTIVMYKGLYCGPVTCEGKQKD